MDTYFNFITDDIYFILMFLSSLPVLHARICTWVCVHIQKQSINHLYIAKIINKNRKNKVKTKT